MPRDEAILLDIVKAARLVSVFVQEMTKERFMQDLKTQSAVQHQLLILGEAVKRLSPAFRADHATIPWSLMAGMRNHLIHGYDTVDLDEVWTTATRDLPALVTALQPRLPTTSHES
jgi:uncharacterized protein with HEPN domain